MIGPCRIVRRSSLVVRFFMLVSGQHARPVGMCFTIEKMAQSTIATVGVWNAYRSKHWVSLRMFLEDHAKIRRQSAWSSAEDLPPRTSQHCSCA